MHCWRNRGGGSERLCRFFAAVRSSYRGGSLCWRRSSLLESVGETCKSFTGRTDRYTDMRSLLRRFRVDEEDLAPFDNQKCAVLIRNFKKSRVRAAREDFAGCQQMFLTHFQFLPDLFVRAGKV